ncbi:MAG: diguanylate cyclase [Coriobacteriia bacterium]|nr:diguanylate cyclase [Coriobacteriia bacterium]
MPTSGALASTKAVRRMRAGHIAAPILLIVYAALSLLPGVVALAARQFVFMVPLVVAAAGIANIIRIAPKGAEFRAWSFLGLAVAALILSEGYYSLYQIYVSAAGPGSPSPADAFNFLAALFGMCTLGVALGVGRLPLAPRLVLGFDLLAVGSILYTAVYAFWVQILAGEQGAPVMASRWAGYSSLGVALLIGIAILVRGALNSRDRRVAVYLALSIGIFAAGMVTWPLWQTRGASPTGQAVDLVDSIIIMVGYTLTMLAVLTRLATSDRGWRATMGRALTMNSLWQSSVISGAVFVAVSIMGYWAYRLPAGDRESTVLVIGASVAVIALVARTGFAAYEMGALHDTSLVDPVTGALNHRAFQDACDSVIARSTRQSIPVALIVLDMDGFSRVNALLGHAAGDEALRAVVSAMRGASEYAKRVYRLSGDEFAVLSTETAPEQASRLAADVLEAITQIEVSPGMTLSASVGVVACDPCVQSKDELLRRADAAQVWAKYHGKGRVVSYDPRIVRALGIEERLRLDDEQSYVEVARALAAAAEARDSGSRYHARNVASLSVLIGEELEFDSQRLRMLEIAAVLHDVGRIAMPDPVMPAFKRGRRDTRLDIEHSELGARLVGSLGVEGPPEWVRAHHENWDGTGFPDGLVGEEIPLEARIIALANAYDALVAGHIGRPPMSKGAALQEIDHGIGSRFDPVLAEKFIEVVGGTASLGWSDEWSAVS